MVELMVGMVAKAKAKAEAGWVEVGREVDG